MTIALVLILGALLVSWTVPRLLEYRLYAGADPQTLLVCPEPEHPHYYDQWSAA